MYTLVYEGTAAVTVSGLGAVVPGSIRKGGGVTTAKVPVRLRTGNDDLLIVQVRQVDPRTRCGTCTCWRPGTWTTSRFSPTRFCGGSAVFDDSVHGLAADEETARLSSGRIGRAAGGGWTGPGGVPVEEIVALANATGRNIWVNIPHHASDDYVRQFAKMLHDTLHPQIMVRLDTDEVWNGRSGSGGTTSPMPRRIPN